MGRIVLSMNSVVLLLTSLILLTVADNILHEHNDRTNKKTTDLAVETLRELILNQEKNKLTNSAMGNDQVTSEQNHMLEGQKESQEILQMEVHEQHHDYYGKDLIAWIRNHGGQVHENAKIGLDPTGSYRGVFVTDNSAGINEGDVICSIPWKLLIKPKKYASNIYWNCDAVEDLHQQFINGEQSQYAPYIEYLMNQPYDHIPAAWTPNGQNLLKYILGHSSDPSGNRGVIKGLPPFQFYRGFEDYWIKECNGTDTPLARAAYFQFTSRDEDTLMVPFYDMCNHINDPTKLNSISYKPRRKHEPFVLRAIRNIEPGEEIYNSYNRCNRCWFDDTFEDCETYSFHDTSDIFEVFGFVEKFPQSWSFPLGISEDEDQGKDGIGGAKIEVISFCLEQKEGDRTLPEVRFQNSFSKNIAFPTDSGEQFLAKQLLRLKQVQMSLEGNKTFKESVPRKEWDLALDYHEALMIAISSAILASRDGVLGDENKSSEL